MLAAVVVGACVIAAVVLQVWRADLDVPFEDRADALHNEQIIRAADRHGWVLDDPTVGAPAGLDVRDFAITGDLTHLVVVKGMTAFTDSSARVMNVFFLASFPMVAASAYVVLRVLRVSRPSAAAVALLFAFLPNHFVRGEDHLYLANYASVPVGAALVLAVLVGSPRWRRPVVLGAALLVGVSSLYHAAFTVTLLALAGLLRAANTRRVREMLPAAALAGVVVVGVAVTFVPTIARRIDDGPNVEVAQRAAAESETYSLKLAHLVLPVSHHRVGPLADLKDTYAATAVDNPGDHPDASTLGIVATVGLVMGAGALLTGALRAREREPLDRAAGVALVLAFVVGTTGGISALIAYVVTPQVRGWGRISMFIAFFALLLVARALDRLGPRRAFAACLVLAVGVLDQTTPDHVPHYDEVAARSRAAASFVAQAEAELPDGAEVVQLPYMPFPESPPVEQLFSYDHFRLSLHSDDLRWTFGAMRGRPEDWLAPLAVEPVSRVAVAAAAAGVEAIEVDRLGYADGGAEVEADLTALLGPAVVDSERWVLFSLDPVRAALERELGAEATAAAGDAALHPIRIEWGEGFHDHETNGTTTWRWAIEDASLRLVNPSDTPVTVQLTAVVAAGGDEDAHAVDVQVGDRRVTIRADGGGSPLRVPVTLPPGETEVRFTTDAPPVTPPPGERRRLVLRVEDLRAAPPPLEAAWRALSV